MSVRTSRHLADAEGRREAWQAQKDNMSEYLRSPEWFAKRDAAFFIWRSLGWLLVGGLLAARAFHAYLFGGATLLLWWPLQLLAAFGFAYALTLRITAAIAHHRMKRVGHHIGYGHTDTKNEVYTERWYEIWPVTEGVNRTESLLRRDKPGRGLVRICHKKPHIRRGKLGGGYLRRTLIAIIFVRFWWVVGVTVGAMWYWSPVVVLGWVERVAGRL